MTEANQKFFEAYSQVFPLKTVYTDDFPITMKASETDNDGWIQWKPIKGTLEESDYNKLEKQFGVLFPNSFIDWHKSYYFLDADCSLIRLPSSNPNRPLENLNHALNWYIPELLIPHKLYPFAEDGNDTGPLVFDGREPVRDNEFPIRIYNNSYGGDIDGLGMVIFSSFPKLLACLTHYLIELKTRKNFEIIPEFFEIDPEGAGKTGIDYWLSWAAMQKANFEEFGS